MKLRKVICKGKLEILKVINLNNWVGEDKPNKKYYDPRVFVRESEKGMIKRAQQAFSDLKCAGKL